VRRGGRGIAAARASEAPRCPPGSASAQPVVARTPAGPRGGERHVSAPILTIHNRHPAAGGIPPAFTTEAADLYIGYFENRHGEQWIFTCDRATREASLRGGDAGWVSAHRRQPR
jgi:hypothetical protein